MSWWKFGSIGRYNSIMRHTATSFLARIMRIDLSVDNRGWTIAARSLSLSSISISRNSDRSVLAWPWLPNLNFSVAAFIHSSSTSLMTSLSALVTSLEVGQTNDDEFLKTTFPKKNLNQGEQLLVFCFRREFSKRLFYSSHRNDKNHRWSVGTNLFTKFWALQDNICTGAHCRAGTGQRCSSFEPAQVLVTELKHNRAFYKF